MIVLGAAIQVVGSRLMELTCWIKQLQHELVELKDKAAHAEALRLETFEGLKAKVSMKLAAFEIQLDHLMSPEFGMEC